MYKYIEFTRESRARSETKFSKKSRDSLYHPYGFILFDLSLNITNSSLSSSLMIYPHLSEGLLLGHMAFISHQGRAILSTPAGGEGGDKAHESLRKLGTTFAWRNIECDYSSIALSWLLNLSGRQNLVNHVRGCEVA